MKLFGLKCSKTSINICNNVMTKCQSSFDSSSLQCNTSENGNLNSNSDFCNNNCIRLQQNHQSCEFNRIYSTTDSNDFTVIASSATTSIPHSNSNANSNSHMVVLSSSNALPQFVTMREKKSGTLTRVQKLKKRLSHSFGRLSVSKENPDVILPFNGYSDEFLDRLDAIGNISDYKTDAQYNHNINWNDRVHRQLSVSSDSKLLDDDIREENKVIMRPKKPPRPKSEVFLSQQNSVDNRRKRYSAFGGDSPYGKSENYIKFQPLGEGSYATVFKGYSTLTNQIIALKEIRLLEEEGAPFTAIREASILKELKHANIVTLHDIVHTKETLTFVFEYLQTDLSHYLEWYPGGLEFRNVKLFLFQLLRGLAYCHKHRVLHRDVKPQNLLISKIGELKLADFGLARTKSVPSHTYSHEVVTLWYRPPDVLLGSTEYSTSLDMWGVGCIFVEMIQGSAIFPGTRDVYSQLDKIFMRLGTPTEKTWPGVTSLPNYKKGKIRMYKRQKVATNWPRLFQIAHSDTLAASLLQLQPTKRISAEEALRHPYFSNLPKKLLELPNDASIFTVEGVHLYPEKNSYKKLT